MKQKQFKKRLKHWLLPGRHNNFHPGLLRPAGLAIVALVIAFIPTVYNVTVSGHMQVLGYATNVTVSDLHSLSNQERASAGVPSLSLNSKLSTAAYNKALDMFADDYWAHTAPDGTTPWSFISSAGYSYTVAGENLAKNFSTSAGVVYGWMNSPSHRENVLGSQYSDVGYAAVDGILQGEETTLVVAMYAAPYVAPAPKPAPAPVATTTPSNTTPPATAEPDAEPVVEEEPVVETPPATEEEEITPVAQAATTNPPVVGEVEGASVITMPVEAYNTLNWGQKTSLFILSFMLLLFIMKHTVIWRASRQGLKDIWLRAHPIAQGSILIIAIVVTIASGTGTIL